MEEPDVTLLLIRGTACDVVGIDSETVLRNMVSESRIVTSEKGCEGPSELPRVTAWYHVPALCTVCQEVTEAEAASGHIKTNGESFHDKTPGRSWDSFVLPHDFACGKVGMTTRQLMVWEER